MWILERLKSNIYPIISWIDTCWWYWYAITKNSIYLTELSIYQSKYSILCISWLITYCKIGILWFVIGLSWSICNIRSDISNPRSDRNNWDEHSNPTCCIGKHIYGARCNNWCWNGIPNVGTICYDTCSERFVKSYLINESRIIDSKSCP